MAQTMTVAIVDDEPDIRELLEITLGRMKLDTRSARNVKEARDWLAREPFDLCLTDMRLPDGNGLEMLPQARLEGWVSDVIVLTAARDAGSVRSALSGGATDFLIKPFTRERLFAALDTVAERREAMRGGERQFTQGALDRLLGNARSQNLPKRVEAHTLEKVLDVLRASPHPLSAEEVGRELGINRATAWRYLEQLVEQRQAQLDLEYGGVGRPTKRYRA